MVNNANILFYPLISLMRQVGILLHALAGKCCLLLEKAVFYFSGFIVTDDDFSHKWPIKIAGGGRLFFSRFFRAYLESFRTGHFCIFLRLFGLSSLPGVSQAASSAPKMHQKSAKSASTKKSKTSS